MAIRTALNTGFQTLEYQKFVEIIDDTNFPPVTAYWENDLSTKTQTFPKTAILTYDVSRDQANTLPNSLPFGDNGAIDAFGRLRVSNPLTVFANKQILFKNSNSFDEVLSGSAVSTYSYIDTGTKLQTLSANDYVIRQSFININYQPGKSQEIMLTGMLSGGTGLDMRYGLYEGGTVAPYDQYTGVFFQNNDNVLSVNIGNAAGRESSQYAPQSAWNIDKLDGSGNSGITLDMTKVQIFIIDFEWLGTGRVRFGFVLDGLIVYCHEFNNANATESTYMRTPNLPVRAEIRQTGNNRGNLLQICCSVNSEGASGRDINRKLSIDTGVYTSNAGISVGVGVEASIMAISLSSADGIHIDDAAAIDSFHVLNNDANTDTKVRIIRNPSYTGTISLSSAQLGTTQTAVSWGVGSSSNTYISGGEILNTIYTSAGQTIDIKDLAAQTYTLGHAIDGTTDEIHIFVTALKNGAGNGLFYASADIYESA